MTFARTIVKKARKIYTQFNILERIVIIFILVIFAVGIALMKLWIVIFEKLV